MTNRMRGWITPQRAEELVPSFFEKRGREGWMMDSLNRRFFSLFGFAEVRVQTKPDGMPDFDRVVIGEAPNINAVVWGLDENNFPRIAVMTQVRPFADIPGKDKQPEEPYSFRQPCVMGFAKRLLGNSLGQAFEEYGAAAIRETGEEAGALGVLDLIDHGWHNPNPTFVASWSRVLEIVVDLNKVTTAVDRTELITKATYESLDEILERIDVNQGWDDNISSRAATPNSALLIVMARHRKDWLGR